MTTKKPQSISPSEWNTMLMQHLILSELMKISDTLAKNPPREDYDHEVQKRMREATAKLVKVVPGKQPAANAEQKVS